MGDGAGTVTGLGIVDTVLVITGTLGGTYDCCEYTIGLVIAVVEGEGTIDVGFGTIDCCAYVIVLVQ